MRKSIALLACLIGVSACTTSHVEDTTDAGIIIPDSARLPDTMIPDAYVEPSPVGSACTSDLDCRAPATSCVADPTLLPDGYCTAMCDEADPSTCPTGSHCVNVGGGTSICFEDCDPSITDARQCQREGYGCSTSFMFSGACVGGCFDASDCGSGGECDLAGGVVGGGACYSPGAAVGDACEDDSTCPMGGLCQTEPGAGWPNGGCITTGCNPVANTGCSGDAQCVTSTSAFGSTDYCVDGCATSADCRDGYVCRGAASHADRLGCFPGCTSDAQCGDGRVCNVGLGTCDDPYDPDLLGEPCSGRDPSTCAGGTCLSEGTYGYPRAYCAYVGCSDTIPCPGNGVCTPTSGAGLCLDGCATDADCRAEYACRPSRPSDPTSPTACVPACETNADCGNAARGFVCNPGTGLCTRPFDASLLGEPCAVDGECEGGRCLSESGTGWPAGTCAYLGCRLAGTGPSITCPAGGTCIDDGAGDPDIGACVDVCAVGSTSCRPGYACVAVDGSTTVGACRPACTDGSCTAGRTCDAATGLCD